MDLGSDAVRVATVADLAAVERVVREAYSPYIGRIGRPPGPMLDDYAALIGSRSVHVVERDGQVQGVLVLVSEKRTMLLDNVAVAPVAQGRGVGRVLLEYAEAAAHAAGFSIIRLYTHVAMVENIDLYGRIGYVETERREERGYQRVYMSKMVK